jgi:hypothetical protein
VPAIEGYATPLSVTPGEEVRFHVSTDAGRFDLEVYREGAVPRLMACIAGVAAASHAVPAQAYAEGCSWPVAYGLTVPDAWPSGAYRARLVVRDGPSGFHGWCERVAEHHVFFVVRAREPGHASPVLLQLCTNTYAAYNPWGGHSLYAYHSRHGLRSHRVSFDRPGLGFYGDCRFTTWELPFVEWAEASGLPLEYASNHDLEARPEILDSYRLVLSVGHDEYWSGPMRDTVEAYVERGGNVVFFSGNSVCWQVRFEDAGRAIRCHKDAVDEDPLYLMGQHHLLTTRWSDPRLSRPENYLTGVSWNYGGYHRSHGMHMDGSGAYTVRRADHWVFDGTGLRDGDDFGAADSIVGYETDGCLYETGADGRPYPTGADGTPRDFQILAQAPAALFAGHQGTACMGLYTRGGTVFTAGTTDWVHGLASDPTVQRITRNILQRLSGSDSPRIAGEPASP